MTTIQIPRQTGTLPQFMFTTLLKLSAGPGLDPSDAQLQRSRRSLDRWGRLFPQVDGVTISQRTMAGLSCELYLPRRAPSNRIIIYMHGGGFAVGSTISHRNLASRLAQAAAIKTISMNYRRTPEHPFPAAQDDCVRLYRHWLDQGIKPANILFCGDSAGGNLVLTSLLKIKQLNLPMPAAACSISPWCDLTLGAGSITGNADKDLILSPALLRKFADLYVPENQRHNPLVSPLYGQLEGLPPLLIQIGSDEILLDETLAMAERARAAGVPTELEIWDGMQHVWHYSALLLKDGRRAIDHIALFFHRHLDH